MILRKTEPRGADIQTLQEALRVSKVGTKGLQLLAQTNLGFSLILVTYCVTSDVLHNLSELQYTC